MKIKFDFKKFLICFVIVFIVNVTALYLWDLLFYGKGTFDIGLSLAVSFAIGVALSVNEKK